MEDIETILMTLMYDGKVERTVAATGGGDGSSQVKLFRAVLPLIEPTGLIKTPCGVCPVNDFKCVYMSTATHFLSACSVAIILCTCTHIVSVMVESP